MPLHGICGGMLALLFCFCRYFPLVRRCNRFRLAPRVDIRSIPPQRLVTLRDGQRECSPTRPAFAEPSVKGLLADFQQIHDVADQENFHVFAVVRHGCYRNGRLVDQFMVIESVGFYNRV